jgi:hypothetical protein
MTAELNCYLAKSRCVQRVEFTPKAERSWKVTLLAHDNLAKCNLSETQQYKK